MIRFRVAGNSSLARGLALVFDMDGVIVDSNAVHIESWHAYLARFGIKPGDDLPGRMFGRHNSEIVKDYFGRGLSPEEIAVHGAAKEALYRRLMKPQIRQRLVPGIKSFVERHRGTPMGIATNAERANLEFVLSESGLDEFFPVRIDGDQIVRPKPAPEIYLRIAESLGMLPRNCVIFEDSAPGVEAARAAGARVVCVRTTHEAIRGADLNIDNFLSSELEPWLCRQADLE